MKTMSTIRPVARASLAEKVYAAILDAILNGELPAGSELSEVGLGERLGVSRTPVREAIRRLAALGLVRQMTSRKAEVARLDRRAVVELYEMRQLLEGEAVARATGLMKRDDITELKAELARLAAAPRNNEWARSAIAFDSRFHDAIAAACGSSRLCEAVRQYRLLVIAFCRQTGSTKNLTDAIHEHQAIVEALASGKAGQARRAMEDHIARRMRTVLDDFYPSS